MSNFFDHINQRQDNNLSKAFDEWDAGVPSSEVWENIEEELILENTWSKLDEELSIERVWNKLDVELPSMATSSLEESYADWQPEMNTNGWAKLEEELSRERVWVRLKHSLNTPISVELPIFKMVASTLLFLSIAFYTDYSVEKLSASNNVMSSAHTKLNSSTEPNHNIAEKGITEVASNATITMPQLVSNLQLKELINQGVKPQIAENKEDTKSELNQTNSETLGDFTLGKKDLLNEQESFTSLYKKPQVILHPKWTIGVGSQAAIINEEKQNALSSALPRLGFAGEAQYHMYFKDFRWSNGFGFAQYKQENGRYLNGRYQQASQNLNTAYFSSNMGYSIHRITFYGGIMVNKLLNGYEGTKSVTTNVYNSKHLQLGGNVGIDYNFKPFKNNTCLGLNVHYQFVPSLKSINQTFDDIHGIGMQLKYSF